MVSEYLKRLPLLLISTLCLPVSAMADWPVAVVDKVAAHPAQSSIRIDPLENDIGDNLELTAVNSWSENGAQISITGDHLSYIPPKKYTGKDGFWYEIKDDQGRTNSIRVSVDVKLPDTALPAPQEELIKTPKNKPIRINVLKNDLFSTTTLDGEQTIGGVIAKFDATSENGGHIEKIAVYPNAAEPFKYQLLYTPPKGFTGTDTFSYSVKDWESDLTGTSDQAVAVTVDVSKDSNIPGAYPTAKEDARNVVCIENQPCGPFFNYVLRNDSGENLTLKFDSSWSQEGGRVFAAPILSTGGASLQYTPKSGFTGVDKVWYVIEDQYGRSNWSLIRITVTSKSDPKVEPPVVINPPVVIVPPVVIDPSAATFFDDGTTEGWTIDGLDTATVTTDGNCGLVQVDPSTGFLCANAISNGGTSYFIAPEKFTGDLSVFSSLNFSLVADGGVYFDAGYGFDGDISISNGVSRASLIFTEDQRPTDVWKNYEIPLNDEAVWVVDDGSALSTVLQSVTELRIRAEYGVGGDSAGLDDVSLE